MLGVTMKRRLSYIVYRFTMAFTRLVIWSLARWEVRGQENIPATGPVILVSNHVHLLDPPLVGASLKRRARPMAKRELFEVPVIGWYLWAYGAFPVRRFSGDMGALRVARNYLRDGDIILMFPEGTRSHADGMRPALPGAAMVALISKAPIVPVGITGSNVKVPRVLFQWLWHDRPRITVTFGPAFDLQGLGTDARAAEAGTDRMMRHIAALLPQEYQGAYGPGSEDEIVVVRQRDRRSSEDDAGERASSAEDGD